MAKTYMKTMTDEDGNTVVPRSRTKAITDDGGRTVGECISALGELLVGKNIITAAEWAAIEPEE